ncbi:MAG: Adaptive-response sensory-kinase SasA [Syntrophus sp. SKADARSKE-3]|nr:Adaptive-response sensory-kinase SasA [Syntrophus sp. SKADARSKE-3]
MSDLDAHECVNGHTEQIIYDRKTIMDIIEGSPIPKFVINKEHKVIFWNRACEELTGFGAKAMIGTDRHYLPFYGEKRPLIADLIVDNDIEGLERYYGTKRVRKSDKVAGAYEARDYYVNLNGKSRHLYFLASPIYNEHGEIIAAVETLQDVTREREMELSLKEYAESLRDELDKNITLQKTIEGIIEGSPIPMFVIDKNHQVMFWNKALAELTGYSAKSMVKTDLHYLPFYSEGRPLIADLIVDNDIDSLNKYYISKKVRISSVITGAYEAWDYYENLGGKSRYLHFQAAPIYDDHGEIIAAIETLEDITREEEMSRNLKEYAESLQNELDENIHLRTEIEGLYNYIQSILENSPDMLIEVNRDGYITFASRGRADGWSVSQITGKHFTETNPDCRDFLLTRWEEVKKGNFQPYEIEYISRKGMKRSFLTSPRPMKDRDRYLFVMRDITEFKELEKKYYETQKLAAMGQLSAGIAHEVRNPLSSIKMSLQILEKRLQPEGNDLRRFKIAQREVEHLEELVNDVLIFARPVEPKKKPYEVKRVVENALEMAEKMISDKNIDVVTSFAEDLPLFLVDGPMLEQALQNLFRNAIEAMENDGCLTISAERMEGDPFAILLKVVDNGCGMEDGEASNIFNPFFTRKKYGTGLGMTQVKKIIDLHHGSIEIESKKGEGTKILLSIPVQAVEQPIL